MRRLSPHNLLRGDRQGPNSSFSVPEYFLGNRGAKSGCFTVVSRISSLVLLLSLSGDTIPHHPHNNRRREEYIPPKIYRPRPMIALADILNETKT